MNKVQIVLVVVAAFVAVGLLNLPKVVVKNLNNTSVPKDAHTDGDTHAEDTTMHSAEVSKEQKQQALVLRNNFVQAKTLDKQMLALDSLVAFWNNAQRLDSAVFYAEKALSLQDGEGNLTRVAYLYYDAFSFALKPEKAQKMAQKAENYLQKVMALNPKKTDAKVKLGLTIKFLNPQQPMKGILLVREASQQDPQNALALFSLGSLFAERSDYAKAVEQFEKLIKIYPNHTEGWAYLASSYEQLGQKEKAIQAWEKVKALDNRPEVQKQVNENLRKLK